MRARAGWLAAYAAATFLSFPHPVGEDVLDLGLVASWLGPACLLLGLRGLPPGAAARSGLLAGWIAHTAIFHWIYVVTVVYGEAPRWIGLLAPAGLALYPAGFVAAFAAAASYVSGTGRGRAGPGLPGPFAVAALWTALEHGRAFALTGFPWALLGYAQHRNGALLGLASLGGVWALGFATALGGGALAQLAAAAGRRERPRAGAWLGLAAVAALHVWGAVRAADGPGEPLARARVAVLQGNIDQGVKWDPAWALRTLETYEDLSRRAAAAGAQVVVWPETAVPGSPDRSPGLSERLADLALELGTALVVGAVGIDGEGDSRRYYDSAFVYAPDGTLVGRYDKAHLVPFGEYVPLRPLLGHFIGALARGVASLDVSPGAGPRALVLPPGPAGGAAVTAGIPICYELLFPDLVRRFAGDGAEILLAITNDAWYGRTGAPYQFLAITALRSAENRVWTARSANTGVSAFIDHRGRVRARTRIFERDFLVADVPLVPASAGGTFYARHGDWLAWGCWIGGAALGIARRRGEART